ncbi:Meiosis regulator and mRNA stability factor 1 [Holothuria leucospilota]|uniref:Meiosis regulator and mRNA stability factor 1 n=1 Tax=Holothuria leucospilota TaxID=206669 RepID=A0A9Q1C378_HOLLE|nr:Meiosis regulator and mRNA stability factor 1 [Holothuria leucospilota]
MSRSADEGKDSGYGGNRGNRHGHGRWSRGGNYYPYHKNELEYHQQVNRPRSTSPIDHPTYPMFNNNQPPSESYYGPHQPPFRQQKNFSGFRRNFDLDRGDGPPRYPYQPRPYSYDRNSPHMDQGVYNLPREYFEPKFNRNRDRRHDRGFQGPPRDWRPQEPNSYPTPKQPSFQSSSDHHSESYETEESEQRETSDYSNPGDQGSKERKSPFRKKKHARKNPEKVQNSEGGTPQQSGTPSVTGPSSLPSLDATVHQLQSQVQWLQQLSQLSMFVSPVAGMAAAPMYPIIPNFQPQSACASCHPLGSVDMLRQLTLASSFPQSASFVPSLPPSSHATPGTEPQDLLAMLRQSADSSSQLPCPKCQEATLCSCPEDDTASQEQLPQDDRDKKSVVGNLSDMTSSPTRLTQSPQRARNIPGAVSSPLRQSIANHQSPLHSLLAQLNLNESAISTMSAIQFQSPDRSVVKDEKSDNLPPIGVFWDIENCTVPSGKSAFEVVRRIRDRFFEGHREAEFMCVCDIKKENSAVIEELNNAQVTVAHINAVAKNAADDKLKQSLRRFAETHSRPATVVLISGDINFAHDLSDLRHRHGLNVILVHKSDSSEALKSCANSTVKYTDLITDLPYRSPGKQQPISESNQLVVHNLPNKRTTAQVRARLEQLSDNCGGKVSQLSNNSAVIKFPNQESAARAKKRLEGEDVFGNQISVSCQKNGGWYANSPRSYSKDNRRRNSFLDDSQRSSPRQDIEGKKFNGDDISDMNNSRGQSEVSRDERRASPRIMGANSPPSNMAPFQKKIPNSTAVPLPPFRPLQERSYSPYTTNGSYGGTGDMKFRRSPAGDAGFFRSIPSVQRVTPPLNQTIFLPDGGISPLPMKGAYRAPTPIQLAANQTKSQWEPPPGVDLLVTNLDNKMTRKELKRLLSAAISKHAQVLHMKLFAPTQGHFQARVRVPTQTDAMRTLLKVNGAQIGAWNIEISLLPASDSNADKLRQMVIPLLQANGHLSMPLEEFKKKFLQKYGQVVYTYDLYQIPETVTVKESSAGKTIALSVQSRPETPNVTGYLSNSSRQSPMIPTRDSTPQPCARWCPLHIKDVAKVVIEESIYINLYVSLYTFRAQVVNLLDMHNGAISLASFPVCYKAEYVLTKDDNGVPLEHLISCIKGVYIIVGHDTYKYICQTPKKSQSDEGNRAAPQLPPPLFNFSREVMELLKHSHLCRVDYHKFATEYHHKFGKQCRVADYGFLKLSELFEAISHSVQVLGEDDSKVITLTHQTQMRRFGQDVLKVLKSQASKQLTVPEFPIAFQRLFGRKFLPAEYGLCSLLDLIHELPQGLVEVQGEGEDTHLLIPKREQTDEEMIKCKKFGREVVELLSREPHHSISFSRFIPAYHRFFNRQCKVGDYGVNKLMELFEALPDIVKVHDEMEKTIVLSDAERLAVLSRMVNQFLPQSKERAITTASVAPTFMKYHGWCPNWQELGLRNCRHLLSKFPHVMENVQYSEMVIVRECTQ